MSVKTNSAMVNSADERFDGNTEAQYCPSRLGKPRIIETELTMLNPSGFV